MFVPRSSSQMPMARNEWIIVISDAAPSTMAASTTWPWPDRCASSRPRTTPNASSMPPPPKSPTRFSGGTGASPRRPIESSAPAERDVVDVVAGGRARTGRPGPNRSCGRTPASGCGPGTRRARCRAARSRPDGTPRSARRRARPATSTTSTPSGLLRSTPTDRRPRLSRSAGGRSGSPPRTEPARSMRMTSAPRSASIMAQNGPGPMPAISMTVIPARGPMLLLERGSGGRFRRARRRARSPRR